MRRLIGAALLAALLTIPSLALAEDSGSAMPPAGMPAHGAGGMGGMGGPGHMGGGMAEYSFKLMDTDSDGFISKEEFMAAFEKWDANHDGKLSPEEWRASHSAPPRGAMGGRGMFPPFKDMDANADGVIDKAEYEAKIKGGGFELIDTDKNGKIEQKEWDSFLKAHSGGMMGKDK